ASPAAGIDISAIKVSWSELTQGGSRRAIAISSCFSADASRLRWSRTWSILASTWACENGEPTGSIRSRVRGDEARNGGNSQVRPPRLLVHGRKRGTPWEILQRALQGSPRQDRAALRLHAPSLSVSECGDPKKGRPTSSLIGRDDLVIRSIASRLHQ